MAVHAEGGEGRSATGPKARRPAVAVALQRQAFAALHLNSCRARVRRPHSEGCAAAVHVSMQCDAHRRRARAWRSRAVHGLHARLAPGAVSVGSGEARSVFKHACRTVSLVAEGGLQVRRTTAAPLAASAQQAGCLTGRSGAVLSLLCARFCVLQGCAAGRTGTPAGREAADREVRESAAGHCDAMHGAAIP